MDPAGRTTSSSEEVLHLRLMCCSAGSWKRGSPGASHLRLDVSVMGSMKGAFLYPSHWVPIASAVPQLLHQMMLRFPWCSPKLTARGRGFVVTCIFKNNPFCSSRGERNPWELFACATPAEACAAPAATWDLGWKALPSSRARTGVLWHTWRLAEESLLLEGLPPKPWGDEGSCPRRSQHSSVWVCSWQCVHLFK